MYGLTPSLTAAQSALSPRYSLSLHAEPRARGGQIAGAPWQRIDALPNDLAAWHLQSIAHDAAIVPAPGSDHGLLRVFLSHLEGALVVQWCSGDDTLSATFTTPAVTTVATFAAGVGIHTPKPALACAAGVWHLYYALPSGDIAHHQSSDNGATWSAAAAVYSGGNAVGDLFALHLPVNDLHVLHFSVLDGWIRPRGAARAGSGSWQIWPNHAATEGWLPAGMAAAATADLGDNQVRLFFTANRATPRRHEFGALDCTLAADGALLARPAALALLHHVAGEAPVRPTLESVGSGFGGAHCTAQLTGATRDYLVSAPLAPAAAADDAYLGELLPVSLTAMSAIPLERRTIAVDRGDRTLLAGLGAVWRSAHRTSSLQAAGSEIIAYRHVVARNRGGALVLLARRTSQLASLQPGDLLWLTRTCAKGADTGAVTLGFVLESVEVAPDSVRLRAVDALGALGESLTSLHFGADQFDDTHALRAFCAWAGVDSDIDLPTPLAAPPATQGFQWRVGEAGIGALGRALRRLPVQVWSRVAAVGASPHLRIAAAAETPLYTYGDGAHPVIRLVTVNDARARATLSVRGYATPNRPDLGEDWALAASHPNDAPAPATRRPIVAVEERTLASAGLGEVAEALAARAPAAIAARLEAQSNLALEVHDRITVAAGVSGLAEETVYTVHAIVELWEKGRCLQHVELCRA